MVELGERNGGSGPPTQWRFGQFRLDAAERTFHYRDRPLVLREKAFELLTLLVSRAPRLMEKEVLRRQLWPQLSVHDNNLAVTVSALRKALQAHEPNTSFFEAIPKRGYRWTHPLEAAGDGTAERSRANAGTAPDLASAARARVAARAAPFVGRERELCWLLRRWEHAAGAGPALAFIGGEAGMGKTMLLERLAAQVRQQQLSASVAIGRCLELSGSTEPYLPWLDALEQLLSGPCAELWRRVLCEQAPSWAARLSLAASGEQQGHGRHPPSPFSVRELVQALVLAARESPILLLLEDFHWADPSSLDVLRALEARAELRGLLVVVSFRPAQARRQPALLSSLLEELAARGRREELSLAGWEPAQLEEYLAARFGAALGWQELARALWQQTEGLPFFATRLAEALAARSRTGEGAPTQGSGAAARAFLESLDLGSVPGIAALIRGQLRQVPDELQPSLQAASVASPDLSTSVLARVLGELPAEIERQLDRLTFEHGLLERVGEVEPVPGTVAVRYRFRHVLLQKHVYEALDSHERRALHLRTARALLAAGARSEPEEPIPPAERATAGDPGPSETGAAGTAAAVFTECAPSLRPSRVAAHFGLGGQAASAVIFWTEAGDQAERAYAPREALSCYALAEELLPELPREQRELRRLFLRHGQGWAWFNLRDLSRAEQCFADIARLAEQLSRGGARGRELAHEYFTRPWSDELVRRTGNVLSPSSAELIPIELQAEALRCQCQILALGERSEALRDRAERLLWLGQVAQSPARVAEGECFLALAALNTGQVERARRLLTGALAVARAGGYRRSQSLALHWFAELQLRQAELPSARELLLELLEQVPAAGDNAVALARLGDTLARLGELPGAFQAHAQAAALFERMDPPRPPIHGWLLRELGRVDEALQLDRAAVARARPLADTHRLTRLLASLASTCCRVGLLGPALEAVDEAEAEICREHRGSAARMHALWDARRELETWRGDWQRVQEICQPWLDLAKAQGHVEGLGAAHRGLAQAQLERGRLAPARSHAVAALALSEERPIALFDWRSHALLSEIARRSGESQLAERSRARAAAGVQAIAEHLEPHHRGAWLAVATAVMQR